MAIKTLGVVDVRIKKWLSEADLSELEALLKNPPLHSVVAMISPKAADAILARYNAHNRAPKTAKIAEFASYMTAGQWWLTGDCLKFSNKQLLRDGQNRLKAGVKANVPFVTHIVFGIPDDAFVWLDRGKPRSGGDALKVAGIDNGQDVAAIVRYLDMLTGDQMKSRITLLPSEVIESYRKYDAKLIEVGLTAARKVYHADKTPRSLAAALYYEFAKRDRLLTEQFFAAWAAGNFAGRFSPMRKASEHLARLKEASLGRVHDTTRAAVWVNCWNLVLRKQRGNSLKISWNPDRPFPAIEG